MEFITNSPAETEKVGEALGKVLSPGSILAYEGDLGAGKTAFTRGLARGLGAKEQVTSPTYTIVNEYLSGRMPLFHFDMYSVCAVEWSENVADAMEGAITVCIQKLGEESRKITITGGTDLEDFSV